MVGEVPRKSTVITFWKISRYVGDHIINILSNKQNQKPEAAYEAAPFQ